MPWFSSPPPPPPPPPEEPTGLLEPILRALQQSSLEAMARDGMASVRQAADSVMSAISEHMQTSPAVNKAQDRLERVQASWRWSGSSSMTQRVPMHADVDERMLMATLSLAKVMHSEVIAHGSAEFLLQRPVTLALVCVNLAAFFAPGGMALKAVCLSPYCVVEKKEWRRLLISAVAHLDATHMMSNLSATLPDCLALEESSGSPMFALEVLGLTVASQGTYVLWAWGQKRIFNARTEYYSVGAVGLSSLAFALQVVSGERRGTQTALSILGGLSFPTRYIWVLQLALSHLCAPDSSFPGHLCGVAAGLMYVYVLEPLLNLTRLRQSERWAGPAGAQQPRFYGAGTTGGRVVQSSDQLALRRAQRAAWWKKWAIGLASQMGLVLLSSGLYTLSKLQRAPTRRPINTWPW